MVEVKLKGFLKLEKKINFVYVTEKKESPSTWWRRNSIRRQERSGCCKCKQDPVLRKDCSMKTCARILDQFYFLLILAKNRGKFGTSTKVIAYLIRRYTVKA